MTVPMCGLERVVGVVSLFRRYEALLAHAKTTKACAEVCAARAFGPGTPERNRKVKR